MFSACFLEFDKAVNVAMIGDGNGWLPQSFSLGSVLITITKTVKLRVFAVIVEVDEEAHH
jgi:hypothetical protein